MFNTEQLQEKWAPVLSHGDLPEIKDSYKKAVTTQLLENQEKFLREERMLTEAPTNAGPINTPTTGSGNVAGFDPVLISLIRRSMPNLIAYDICGVQPMNGPTGLSSQCVPALSPRLATRPSTTKSTLLSLVLLTTLPTLLVVLLLLNQPCRSQRQRHLWFCWCMDTSTAELWRANTSVFPEMAFSIEKIAVTAKSRSEARVQH